MIPKSQVASVDAGPQPASLTQAAWRLRSAFGYSIPLRALGRFFDLMALLLHGGVSIPDAITRAAQVSDPELKFIFLSTVPSVSCGASLTQALRPHRRRLPELVLPILEVGEVSGTLETACRRLADAFVGRAELESRFTYAVYNPWYIIAAISVYVAATSASTAPMMIRMLLVDGAELSALYLAGRLIYRALMTREWLRYPIDTLKLAIPHLGDIHRKLAVARWARSFTTLWHAGVPISEALEVSSRSALNANYERVLLKAARSTRQGGTISESLASADYLPGSVVQFLQTAEMTGGFGQTLEPMVRMMEDEAFGKTSQEFMMFVTGAEFLLLVIGAISVLR